MARASSGVGRAWRREIAVLAAWLAGCTIAGFLFNLPLTGAFVGLLAYLAVNLGYAYRLHRWLANEDPNPPDGIGIWQEIYLEFYRLRERNRRRKRRLKSIVNEFQASTAALPDGAVVLDAQGCILWFNQAAAVLLALRSQHDMGQRVVNLVRHPDFSKYMAGGDFASGGVEVPSPVAEEGVLSLRVIPYGNNQKLLIARDVSAQKRLEATRRDFVANASHELRTPLTVLRGYLEMMAEDAQPKGGLARWREPIQEMSGQALRMARIIESLLKLARVEAEGFQQRQELVDVPALISRLVADARRTDTRNQHLEAEIEAGLFLYGRAGELESVFENLLANAVRYTPEDGDIVLRWWLDQEAAWFSITDSGVGIEAKHIPRLTERFYRVDASRTNAGGGTGLGLAIVKHCLEHHEAELEIASEVNTGSVFSCRFPRQRAQLRDAA